VNNQIFFGFLNLAIALFVTEKTIPKLIIFGKKFNLIDKSDKRKKNRDNMVRIGGVAIFLGFFISQIIWFCFYFSFKNFGIENILLNKNVFIAIFGMLFFFLIGLLEDFLTLSPFLRLALQALIMSIVWYQGFGIKTLDINFLNFESNELILSSSLSYLLTFLWLVGVTNAINWIDGLDGLLSGVALINFLGMALISFSQGEFSIFYLSLSLVGCCAAFLKYNFYPSKIFMGDSGSYFLGFSLAALSILTFTGINGENIFGTISLHKSFILLSVPIVDMIFVIFLRLMRGKSPFYPDRSHLHFRILDTGIGIVSTVSIIYALVIILTTISYAMK
tara:strand:+ start:982 stop:1983 length:1002 start_codon:yes stop_codon:yes gene_type:complete